METAQGLNFCFEKLIMFRTGDLNDSGHFFSINTINLPVVLPTVTV